MECGRINKIYGDDGPLEFPPSSPEEVYLSVSQQEEIEIKLFGYSSLNNTKLLKEDWGHPKLENQNDEQEAIALEKSWSEKCKKLGLVMSRS